MARLFGISLILILVIPFFGTWLWLQNRLTAARYDATKAIDAVAEEALVLWAFTLPEANTLDWKHSKEFQHLGEMYDIVRTETRGDSVWYWCYHDRKETKIRNQIRALLVHLPTHPPGDLPLQNRIIDYLKQIMHPPADPPLQSIHRAGAKQAFVDYVDVISEAFQQPVSPPPRYS